MLRILNNPPERAVRFLGRNGAATRGVVLFQAMVLAQAFALEGYPTTWLTSATEGQHSKGSLHPHGWAVDLDLTPDPATDTEWERLLAVGRLHLGVEFQLIYEPDPGSHLHLEFDPGWG